MAQLDTLGLNSLPDLSCSCVTRLPFLPLKSTWQRNLLRGLKGFRPRGDGGSWRWLSHRGRGGVREKPGLIRAKGLSVHPLHSFPFRPLHVSPAPHQRNTQSGHFVSRSAPRHRGAGVPGVVICSSFCSRRQGNPEDLPLPPALTSTSPALLPPHFRSGLCTASPPQGPDCLQCQPVPPFQDP